MFDFQPILQGTLIELRPLHADDKDALFAVASDPLIWEQHPEKQRSTAPGFEVFFRDAIASGGALAAIDSATQKIIGTSRYHGYNAQRSEIEIGWTFLARSYWGGRYNGEMKSLMLRHAFRFVDNVVFIIAPQNFRSQRAVEKIGALRIATRPDCHEARSLTYRISASAFKD